MRKYMYMNMTNIAPFKTIWDTLNYNKTFSLLFNQKAPANSVDPEGKSRPALFTRALSWLAQIINQNSHLFGQ